MGLLQQEMEARAFADDELSRKIAGNSSQSSGGQVGQENLSGMKSQLAELNSLLEAEVDARCAVMQRLEKQVLDQQKLHDERFTKLQTSIQEKMRKQSQREVGTTDIVQGDSPALEDFRFKVEMLIEAQSQKLDSTNLQVNVFRDNANAVAAEASKKLKWVESQHEKITAKQFSLEASLQDLRQKLTGHRLDSSDGASFDVRAKLSSLGARQDSFESALQEIRFKLSNNERLSLANAPNVDLQEELKDIKAMLAMNQDSRFSEPAPRPHRPSLLEPLSSRMSEPSSLFGQSSYPDSASSLLMPASLSSTGRLPTQHENKPPGRPAPRSLADR